MLRFYGPVNKWGHVECGLPKHTFTGQVKSSKRLTSIVHYHFKLKLATALLELEGENDHRK